MPRTKLQAKLNGDDKKPPLHLTYVKQETGGWRIQLLKGGTLPKDLKGLYLTDRDAERAAELWYATQKR